MKKALSVILLIVAGIVAAIALILGAVIDLIEGILSIIFWSVIILVGYFYVRKKVND